MSETYPWTCLYFFKKYLYLIQKYLCLTLLELKLKKPTYTYSTIFNLYFVVPETEMSSVI